MPKRSKPPRTNIDKQIEEILHNKIDHQLDDWSEAVPALKQLLLTYIKELTKAPKGHIPDEECCDLCDVRNTILKQAEEELTK